MKLLLTILTLLSLSAQATTYYVAENGSDNNSGTLQGNAWKTLQKVNSSMGSFTAGDQILLNRGDVFFGNITPTKDGLYFGAYGSGALPVVTATKQLTFTASGATNIYNSNSFLPQSNPKFLTIGGVVQAIGRWPNASNSFPYGYLNYDNTIENKASNYTDLIDNDWGSLSKPATDFTGGEIAVRVNKFRFVTYPITTGMQSTSGSTVTFRLPRLDGLVATYGYFIQNHIKTLDQNTEWCWNDASNTASIYLTAGPSGLDIEMPCIDENVSIGARNNLTFENIWFTGANKYAFNLNGGSNITIKNCKINNVGNTGINYSNTINLTITGTTFDYIFRFACKGTSNGQTTFIRNTFSNIFPILGMGEGGNVAGTAIDFHGSNKLVSRNYFTDLTYAAVGFYDGSNQIVERNIVVRFCKYLHDGGAFYSDNRSAQFQHTNRIIRQNITKGEDQTTPWIGTFELGNPHTIYSYYADKWTKGVTFEGNVDIAGYTGLYANDPLGNTWKNNFLWNTSGRFIEIRNNAAQYTVAGNIIDNNVGFSNVSNPGKGMWLQRYNAGSIGGFGTFNNNYYVRPYSSGKPFTTYINGVSATYSLPEWQGATPYEDNGHLSPRTLTSTQNPSGYTRFFHNESDTVQTYSLGNTEWYTSRAAVIPIGTKLVLQPFTAEALIYKSGDVVADPNQQPDSGSGPPPTDPPTDPGPDPNPNPPPVTPEGVIKIKSKYKIIHVTQP